MTDNATDPVLTGDDPTAVERTLALVREALLAHLGRGLTARVSAFDHFKRGGGQYVPLEHAAGGCLITLSLNGDPPGADQPLAAFGRAHAERIRAHDPCIDPDRWEGSGRAIDEGRCQTVGEIIASTRAGGVTINDGLPMVLDYRDRDARDKLPIGFRCLDAVTGEEVHDVFYIDRRTHQVGRYLRDERGLVYLDPKRTDALAAVWERRPLRLERLDPAGGPPGADQPMEVPAPGPLAIRAWSQGTPEEVRALAERAEQMAAAGEKPPVPARIPLGRTRPDQPCEVKASGQGQGGRFYCHVCGGPLFGSVYRDGRFFRYCAQHFPDDVYRPREVNSDE